MQILREKIEALDAPQRLIWNKLGGAPNHFVLYGGTAIALHLGHRQSVDFDFFSSLPFPTEALKTDLAALLSLPLSVLQQEPNTLTLEVESPRGPVKLSFFGGLKFARVGDLFQCQNKVQSASLDDLFALKLRTIVERVEKKDYLDLAAILRSGKSLPHGLACLRAVCGKDYNLMLPLQALCYFEDPGLKDLEPSIKEFLRETVRTHEGCLQELPEVTPVASSISPACPPSAIPGGNPALSE